MTSAISLWNITELTCLLFLSSFLCALYACSWFSWPLVCFMEMPFPCIALGANAGLGFLWCPRLVSETPVAVLLSSTLWCQSIQRIRLCFPLTLPPSLSFIHTWLFIADVPRLVHVRHIHKPSGYAMGEAHIHTQAHEHMHTRTTVFPPSRICSIFPHESCGIRPISSFLPVSSSLALKCVWSLWDLLYHYSWTSLFCNCLCSFNEFSWCRTVGGL